jgi:shikimate kinase
MNPAPNLVLVGPMGAGKTAIGRRIAERFSLQFVDLDQRIVDVAGTSIPSIFEHAGEAGFRLRECQALAETLAGEGLLMSTGGGAVLDAENRALMRSRGFVVYLQVGLESQLRRVGKDRNRPLLQTDNPRETLRQLSRTREPLYREVADLMLDTDGLNPGQATASLTLKLARQWQRSGATA